ncbi:hypothetical protein ACGFZP_13135 [Kitasatospora sp. NPDC048239]|uniref:hypothetical protein n=1 Tax=Kitasatospora sp. NPDC048239 TaxID=3364046 RepID=UPI0037246CE5
MRLLNRAIDSARSQRYAAEARREHDQWVNTVAKLGVTYYTIAPIGSSGSGGLVHGDYQFDRKAKWGVYTGQLMAGQTPSWQIWSAHGPLTDTPQWTGADQHRHDEELSARFSSDLHDRVAAASAGIQDDVAQRYLAAQLDMYPATRELLRAA